MLITSDWYPYAGWYVRNWKAARESLDKFGQVRIQFPGWYFPRSMNRTQFDDWIRRGIEARINAKGGIEPTGRKATYDYQIKLRRDQRAIQDHAQRRLRIYQFETAEARKRFSHYLSDRKEDY